MATYNNYDPSYRNIPYQQEYETMGAPPSGEYIPQQNNTQPPPPVEPPPAPTRRGLDPAKYAEARDDWMGGNWDISNQDAARNSAKAWADKWNVNYLGDDAVDLYGDGGSMDIIHNLKSGQNMLRGWTPTGGPGGSALPNNGPAPAAAPPAAAAAPSNIPPGISDELYQMLLSRAKQGTAIDKNDPNIRQQVDPYAAAQERARRDYLADAAERSGPLVNLRGEQRLAMERAGQATGLFESQLIGRELENRRAEIIHALDSLGAKLSDDQRLALQKELGYLNDATQRYGIEANKGIAAGQLGLGQQQLGLSYSQFDWDRDPRNPRNYFE